MRCSHPPTSIFRGQPIVLLHFLEYTDSIDKHRTEPFQACSRCTLRSIVADVCRKNNVSEDEEEFLINNTLVDYKHGRDADMHPSDWGTTWKSDLRVPMLTVRRRVNTWTARVLNQANAHEKQTKQPLSQALGTSLWEKKLGIDVELRIGDDISFEAHKAVLAARSEKFAGMFYGYEKRHCRPATTPSIETFELDFSGHRDTFEIFLKFLYTDSCPALEDIEQNLALLCLANEYLVDGLQLFCETSTMRIMARAPYLAVQCLTEENISVISPCIYKICIEYLSEHPYELKDCRELKEWAIERPHLLLEVIETMTKSPVLDDEPPRKRLRTDETVSSSAETCDDDDDDAATFIGSREQLHRHPRLQAIFGDLDEHVDLDDDDSVEVLLENVE